MKETPENTSVGPPLFGGPGAPSWGHLFLALPLGPHSPSGLTAKEPGRCRDPLGVGDRRAPPIGPPEMVTTGPL